MIQPQFTPEQVEIAKRTIQTVSQAYGDYPYHESVTPMDIRGHTLQREDVRLSYRYVPLRERNGIHHNTCPESCWCSRYDGLKVTRRG